MFHKVAWRHNYARCDGSFSNDFSANLARNLALENIENRLSFDRITAIRSRPHFFGAPCSMPHCERSSGVFAFSSLTS